MQIELTPKQMQELAREIAIAQAFAVDDYISEQTANWLPQHRVQVPHIGASSQAERVAKFRATRATAEAARAKHEQEQANQLRRIEASKQRHAEEMSERVQADQLRYEKELATWKHDAHIARQEGKPEPSKPQPARTSDDFAKEASRSHFAEIF